jgi:hypothetical protein
MNALEAIVPWADAQPAPGSFIAIGAHSPVLEPLAQRGWKGVWICPWPSVDAVEWATKFRVGVIAAALVHTSVRMTPVAPGLVSATLHPSELYELWADDALPEPRFASLLAGEDSGALFEALRDWVQVQTVEVQLPSDETRRERLRAILGPWRTLNLEPGATTILAGRA